MTAEKRTQKLLRESIADVHAGRLERARANLLKVLEQAPDLEDAWWWLSRATEDTAEQQRALQKVVALNPDHDGALARLVGLRLKGLPAAPAPPPAASPADDWAERLPQAPLEDDDGTDNPYQCPFCGKPTGTDDKRCPHCRGHLYRRVALSGNSETLRRLQLMLGLSMAVGLLELAAPLLAQGFRQGEATPANYELLLALPGVEAFLGNFLRMAPAIIDLLLKTLAARAVVFVLLILGLRARWRLAYYAAMLGVAVDVLFSSYLLVAGYLGWAGVLLNIALTAAAGLMLFAVSYEFAVNHERLLVRPDSSARGPVDFFRRGHAYRRQGMWAMAVAQWRKAVGLAPHETTYYKDLGIGYAHIGRFDRSLRALHEARRRQPNSAELEEVIALVEAQAQQRGTGPAH